MIRRLRVQNDTGVALQPRSCACHEIFYGGLLPQESGEPTDVADLAKERGDAWLLRL